MACRQLRLENQSHMQFSIAPRHPTPTPKRKDDGLQALEAAPARGRAVHVPLHHGPHHPHQDRLHPGRRDGTRVRNMQWPSSVLCQLGSWGWEPSEPLSVSQPCARPPPWMRLSVLVSSGGHRGDNDWIDEENASCRRWVDRATRYSIVQEDAASDNAVVDRPQARPTGDNPSSPPRDQSVHDHECSLDPLWKQPPCPIYTVERLLPVSERIVGQTFTL